MFNLALDSRLRGCDLVNLRVQDIAHGGKPVTRAGVIQQKTRQPVKFELTDQTRNAVEACIARYRQAFEPSRAKDDPSDAEMALDILLRHPEKLQALTLQSTAMRTLTTLVEQRRDLATKVISLTNSLSSMLKCYYPQVLVLDWFERRNTLGFCDFLSRWPTLKQVKRARRSSIETFFDQHNVRRAYLVEKRIHGIRTATPLTEDEAMIRPNQMLV